jgi:ADP-ribose pyrophosphatase
MREKDSPVLGSDSEIVYANDWSSIVRSTTVLNGQQKEIYTSVFGRRAGVVVVNEQGILLVRQERLLTDGPVWEIPGGRAEVGESFEDAARRECEEESGVLCKRLELLTSFHQGLDTVFNPTAIFLCKDFELREFTPNTETIQCGWHSIFSIKELIKSEAITDSLTLLGVTTFLLTER